MSYPIVNDTVLTSLPTFTSLPSHSNPPKPPKMSLLRHVIKSTTTTTPRRILRRDTPRHFSTAGEQPPSSVDSAVDTILQDTSGSVYGKLQGIERHTLKSDILHYFDGSNLRNHDLKVSYNRNFAPIEMLIQFPSLSSYVTAQKSAGKKGRIFRLEKAGRSEWDILRPYDGKTVLLLGLPQYVQYEDIDRFLAGCDSHSVELLNRPPAFGRPIKLALVLVHFPSHIAAANAVITKNRGFCLNNQVTMRVLE